MIRLLRCMLSSFPRAIGSPVVPRMIAGEVLGTTVLLQILNRRFFECFPTTLRKFFKKENESKLPVQKVYEARFCLVQKMYQAQKYIFSAL